MQQYLCVYRWNEERELFELVSALSYSEEGLCGDGIECLLSRMMARMYPEGWSTMYWDGEMLQSPHRHNCCFGVFQDVESVVLDPNNLFDSLTSLMENYY